MSEAPSAKQPTSAAQSLTCPSPARQIEPAPQPPASVIPMPKSVPPASAPMPAPGNTQSPLSLRSTNFRIAKPSVLDRQSQRRGPRVLGVAGHERLTKGAHQAEARALEDHAEDDAEQQEHSLRVITPARA